jgi:hypothetical protein
MRLRNIKHLALALSLGIADFSATNCLADSSNQKREPLVLDSYGSFFVGGRDIHSDYLVRPDDPYLAFLAPTGTITVDQMYVQYKIPLGAHRVPIILIHGCCLTGKSYETRPDGGESWEEYFLRQGHPVYIIDQPTRGRSGREPTIFNQVAEGKADPSQLPVVHTAGHEGAWLIFRFGPQYPEPFPGLQFPLDSLPQFWAQIVQDYNSTVSAEGTPLLTNLSLLAKKLGHAVLISHSQTGPYPEETAIFVSPQGIDGIVSIEGLCLPDFNNAATTLAKIPTMFLYGDNVDKSPIWPGIVQGCQAWAGQVNSAGGNTTVVQTPQWGLHGNTHMMMLDRTNIQVAQNIDNWIAKNVESKKH